MSTTRIAFGCCFRCLKRQTGLRIRSVSSSSNTYQDCPTCRIFAHESKRCTPRARRSSHRFEAQELESREFSIVRTALENDNPVALITDLTGNIVPRITQPGQYRSLVAYIRESVVERHLEGLQARTLGLSSVSTGTPAALTRCAKPCWTSRQSSKYLPAANQNRQRYVVLRCRESQDETLRRAGRMVSSTTCEGGQAASLRDSDGLPRDRA